MNGDEINGLLQTTEDPKTAKRLFNELTMEAIVQGKQPVYFTAYASVKLTQDTQGALAVEFHSNGGPLAFTVSRRYLCSGSGEIDGGHALIKAR